ncbi:hypothetical protein ACH0BE_00695 [Bacillus subtilis]|uniref:hypothetical protein n=1 Tax=Bacillus subtilis TaxID=1423 RepID=UPI001C24867A|nr:hypothetical protein [Bacillus subtilis]MBU8803421.1 hypothetical protein [Bacillus subtilis]
MTTIVCYKYDPKTHLYLEPVEYEESDTLPINCTKVPPPPGLYLAKYSIEDQSWVESANKDYIDSLKNSDIKPSDIDILGQSLTEARITILKQARTITTMQSDIETLKGRVTT